MANEIPLSDSPRRKRTPVAAIISPSGLATLPADWQLSPLIEPHAPAIAQLDISGLTPEHLNGVARFSLERADFLWALTDAERSVTFSSEQLQLLADAFETIGGELGDGVGGPAPRAGS